jgi:hypothetical protein
MIGVGADLGQLAQNQLGNLGRSVRIMRTVKGEQEL